MTQDNMNCPHCDIPADLVREERAVPLGQRRVQIDDEFLRCGECEEEFYTPELADRRHQRAVDRARLEDNLLSPSQIRDIREQLGLTQRVFEQVLGVGEKTCVRWEMGRVCQNVATDRLIRLIAADRSNIERLASINGVVLPDTCFVPSQQRAQDFEQNRYWGAGSSGHPLGPVLLSGNSESALNTGQYEAIVSEARGAHSGKLGALVLHGSFVPVGGQQQ